MPTRLPLRRNFLRRYAPDAETAQNIKSTVVEFTLAIVFVAVTVMVIFIVERNGAAFPVASNTAPLSTGP